MEKYLLTCDTAVDLNLEYLKSKNIPFVSFHYNLDGQDYTDDLGVTLSYEEFYKKIDAGSMPVTSQVNIADSIDFFESFLKEGYDILHLAFSSGLSGTFNSAYNAAEELKEKYPDRKIVVIDSLAASSGYGLLLDEMIELKENGATLEELTAFAEENKLKVQHWFYTTDLTHFKRGGRISATACAIGNFLNLCPLMNVDAEGKLAVQYKIKGKKKAAKEAVAKMLENCDGGENYSGRCFISNSGCLEDAEYLAGLLKETFPNIKGGVKIFDIGTIIGTHTGRGTVALFFFGKKREN
ncbi:MAG: DegV family protein [Lachnospiraceae bacterium]|nr:DegV family protein [Lachnospiraceae bacterium]